MGPRELCRIESYRSSADPLWDSLSSFSDTYFISWNITHRYQSQKSERNIGHISVKYISKIINIIHMYQLKYQSDISLKKNQSQISITNISQISVKKYNFAPLQRSYVNETHLQKTSDKKNWHYCSYFSHNSYFSEGTFLLEGVFFSLIQHFFSFADLWQIAVNEFKMTLPLWLGLQGCVLPQFLPFYISLWFHPN